MHANRGRALPQSVQDEIMRREEAGETRRGIAKALSLAKRTVDKYARQKTVPSSE